MRTIKNLLATIALLFCSGTMDAYDFIVDGIYYDITSIEKLTVSVVNPANNVSIANSSPYEGDFVISSTVNFEGDIFTVTGIGRKAFFNGNITSIVLPETLRRIESEAFYSNDELNSIIIPQNLEYIGPSAFDNCKKLKEIFFVGNNYPDTEYYTGAGETYPFDRTFATLKIYVKDSDKFNKTGKWRYYEEKNKGKIVEYVTFEKNNFYYNGKIPTVTYTNNLANKYELAMDVSDLAIDAGMHETTFKAVYSNGLELDIPYTYTINKAPLTINVNDAEKVYGDENPQFTYSFSGFVNNEDESVLSSAVSFSTKANKNSGAGTYGVAASATAKNYEIGCTEGTLTVKKAPITVAVNAKSRVYGDANPQFNFTYVGLKNGDGMPVFTSELSTSTKATKYSDVGDYEVMVSGGVATNYSFTEYIAGTLTITQAPLIISAQSTVREYGEANPEFKFAYSGFKNDDDVNSLIVVPTMLTSVTPTSSVGEYEITPNGAEATNYAISYISGTLTVNKAPLTIQAEAAERVYGEENPKFTFAYYGFKNEESFDVLTNRPSAKTDATVTSVVGAYDIVPSGAEAQNYNIAYKNGTLTVTKAPLKVSAVSTQKEYGETNPTIALVYSGFKNNDNEECISEKPVVAIDADRKSDVGEYAITVSGGSAQNYAFTEYNEGVLTVVKAPLSVIAENKERLYFEANPEFTYYCEGFKNDDTKDVLTTQPNFECGAKQTSGAGEYEITLDGANAKNYELSYQGGTLTVGKRTIDVKVGDYTRVYNEENPEFTVSYEGFVNNESEKVFTIMPTLYCAADKTADVGSYEITASGAEATNYDFNYTSGTLTIEKATQEIIWEQSLEEVEIGDQVELTALATSGLDIEYEIADNNFVSIYEGAGKVYLDCFGVGQIVIKAIQSGNKNYHSAVRVSKKLIITDPSGIENVTGSAGDSYIYNIRGERMTCKRIELQKGIYIQDGKKFVVE